MRRDQRWVSSRKARYEATAVSPVAAAADQFIGRYGSGTTAGWVLKSLVIAGTACLQPRTMALGCMGCMVLLGDLAACCRSSIRPSWSSSWTAADCCCAASWAGVTG
ncbi:protein of unknown function [Modestobacter italicus]|uniref:Uncharacterized protein n=1 Tax=Modestobacter italicus (strain DSM 44449 / CECT 9708 / BC 501) TaxID=2732864 RepID=I4F3C3_MODI5|nr:protein of unknown function [Modestobacter marinus]